MAFLVVSRSQNGGVFVALATGSASYADLVDIGAVTTSRSYGLAAADFDGDGVVDIIASHEDPGVINLFRGKGDGTFDPQVDLDNGTQYATSNVEVGDVDEDGRLDFVVGLRSGNSGVFLGR